MSVLDMLARAGRGAKLGRSAEMLAARNNDLQLKGP